MEFPIMLFSIMIGIALIVGIFMAFCYWKIFAKAGRPGWYCLIPFLNICVFLRMGGLSGWCIFLCFIPFVNIVFIIGACIKVARAFQQEWFVGVALAIFPILGAPWLAFDKSPYIKPLAPAAPGSAPVTASAVYRPAAGNDWVLATITAVVVYGVAFMSPMHNISHMWAHKSHKVLMEQSTAPVPTPSVAPASTSVAYVPVPVESAAKVEISSDTRKTLALNNSMLRDGVIAWDPAFKTLRIKLYDIRLSTQERAEVGASFVENAKPFNKIAVIEIKYRGPNADSFATPTEATITINDWNKKQVDTAFNTYNIDLKDLTITGAPMKGTKVGISLKFDSPGDKTTPPATVHVQLHGKLAVYK